MADTCMWGTSCEEEQQGPGRLVGLGARKGFNDAISGAGGIGGCGVMSMRRDVLSCRG